MREGVAARVHPPVVPDPEQGCDACGEPMTNHDADGQWCDKHGKQSAASGREFMRPAEEDERAALRWLMDQREFGGPLERKYAAAIIDTLAYFEQEVPVDTRP